MNKLEAQAIIEGTGNYDEEEIEEILDVYEEVIKHVGFKDERRDKRYVVKFHDICYYVPHEYEEEHEGEFWGLFDEFCGEQIQILEEYFKEEDIDIDEMLSRYYCGHYQTFKVDIPEINDANAVEIAMNAYYEFNYKGGKYVKDYIEVVNSLQELEDNYMEYWIEFLSLREDFPDKYLKEIKENYKRDKEKK